MCGGRYFFVNSILCRVPAGKLLFKAGDHADECYVLVSGRLRIFSRRPGGVAKTLLEASRGESVGELSLLTHGEYHSGWFRIRIAFRQSAHCHIQARVAFQFVIVK